MDAFEPKQYNGSPSAWLVREYEQALALGARQDVNIVIWDRPALRDAHLAMFNDPKALDSWKNATGGYKRSVIREVVLDKHGEPVSLKVENEEFMNAARAQAPSLMWDNFRAVTGLVSTLTDKPTAKGRPFRQTPGQNISESSSSTVIYHHHYSSDPGSSELTAHVSLNDAGIRLLLNRTAFDAKGASGKSNFLPNSDIPADAKFYDSTAGQIVLFKPHVLHKTSAEGLQSGRYAEAAFESYKEDVKFSF